MAKMRVKLKGKGKRWAKGQSSSSNPLTRKFRDKARSSFFQPSAGNFSALTTGAVKNLESINANKTMKSIVKEDSASIVSQSTSKTFASDWSQTSNMSFNKFLTNYNNNSSLQKEMLAVLSAVTDVIKQIGGTETSAEYFRVLMTVLETSNTEDSTAAIVSLLCMGIKTVPENVLRLKFSETSKVFLNLLGQFSEIENVTILKSAISCLAVILRAQDSSIWTYSSTSQLFDSVLVFTIHSKPKVRKAAQHAVCAILKASCKITEGVTHPGSLSVAKFCIQHIESNTHMGGSTTTLHVLSLLKEVIATFPKNYIKASCETILKLMTLGNVLVSSCSLEVLHGLFVSAPPTTRLSAVLNARILNALYDYQPPANDTQPTLAWLTVMQEAHNALARSDPQLCGENVTKFFVTGSALWLSDKPEIVKGTTLALRAVAFECLRPLRHTIRHVQIYQCVFAVVEDCLKYQYYNAWPQVLSVLGVLFEVMGSDDSMYMSRCLKSMADLRDSHNFTYVAELEFTFGKAIRALGPEMVLQAVPLPLFSDKEEPNRFWMLPVLKENVIKSTIQYFCQHFLPMAAACEMRAKELNAANDRVTAHSFSLLHSQIWSMLPSFCGHAEDVNDNLKMIAQMLGGYISSRKDLRMYVMAALRKMIARNQELSNESNLAELARYSKNYLPILFNLYITAPCGSDEEGQKLAAMETIKVYLQISPADLNNLLFDKALDRLEADVTISKNDKENVMDLVKVLLPYQNQERIQTVFDKCVKLLKETKCPKLEKRAYRLLEELCSSTSESCRQFVRDKLQVIQTFLLNSLKKKKVTNRGARLRCLLHVVRALPPGRFKVIKQLVPETIVCCRDINKRSREYAFQLVEQMYLVCQEWAEKPKEDVMRDYVGLLMAGLAGSATLMSATLLALTKLVHSLRADLPTDLLRLVLDNVLLLSATPTREVVGPCVGFIKLIVSAFPKETIQPFVPELVKAMVDMSEDCKRHFRLKTRDVLSRLMRKFGYNTIISLVPADDTIFHRRLKNMRRVQEKKKLTKDDDTDEDNFAEEFAAKAKPQSIEDILKSSDESDSEEADVKGKMKTNRKRKQKKAGGEVYIQEDSESIVDLVSAAATGRMSATKPSAGPSAAKPQSHFKTTQDGKFIITDEGRASGSSAEDTDEDSDVDHVTSELSDVVIGRKRKLSLSGEPPNKYQAGGHGIHRPLSGGETPVRISKIARRKIGNMPDPCSGKTGHEYRAKKAKGDMKLKGKPDPYAYLPLSRKWLSKRKKVKSTKTFNNLVKSAVKGAKMGSKAKAKKRR